MMVAQVDGCEAGELSTPGDRIFISIIGAGAFAAVARAAQVRLGSSTRRWKDLSRFASRSSRSRTMRRIRHIKRGGGVTDYGDVIADPFRRARGEGHGIRFLAFLRESGPAMKR